MLPRLRSIPYQYLAIELPQLMELDKCFHPDCNLKVLVCSELPVFPNLPPQVHVVLESRFVEVLELVVV